MYVIVESVEPVGQVSGLDQYIFVVRRWVGQCISTTLVSLANCESLDKKIKVITCYIDVKSEHLRDILRDVLKDIKGVSLNKSKLSVSDNPTALRLATYSIQSVLSSSYTRARMKSPPSIKRGHCISDFLWTTWSTYMRTRPKVWHPYFPPAISRITCSGPSLSRMYWSILLAPEHISLGMSDTTLAKRSKTQWG
jgi:hypothetical protein